MFRRLSITRGSRMLVLACAFITCACGSPAAFGQKPSFGAGFSRPRRAPNPKPGERADDPLTLAIKRGNQARDSNDYREALLSYRKALELNPQDERVYYGFGNLYSDLFCNDAAIEAYLDALRINKDYLEARIGLGYTYAEEERFDHAQTQFKEALAIAPNNIEANIGQAIISAKKEKYAEAFEQVRRLLSSRSKSDQAIAYIALGDVYLEQEHHQEALAQYEKAINLQSDFAKAYAGVGKAKLLAAANLDINRINEPETREAMHALAKEAYANLKRAIELKYNQPDIHAFLALTLSFQFRYPEAATEAAAYFSKIKELESRLTALGLNCDSGFNLLKATGNVVLAFVYLAEIVFEAKKEREAELLNEAMKLSEEAIKLKDDRSWVYQVPAVICARRGDHTKAIEYFQKQILYDTKESEKAQAFNGIGLSYIALGRDDEAIKNLKEAIKRNQNAFGSYRTLAGIFAKQGNIEEGISWLTKATQLKQEAPLELYYELAYQHILKSLKSQTLNDLDEAIILLKQVIQKKPDYVAAYQALGLAYSRKSNIDEAMVNYKKAVEVNPSPDTYISLAGAYSALQHNDPAAIEALKNAIALKSDNGLAYQMLALAYQRQSNSDEAIANYEKAAKYDPGNSFVFLNMADTYVLLKHDDDGAIEALKKAIALHPDFYLAYWRMCQVYRHKRDDTEALRQILEAIKYEPRFAPSYLELAAIQKSQRKYAEASESLKTAIKLDPANFYPYKELAKICEEQQAREEAIHYYEEATKRLKPDALSTRALYSGRIARLRGQFAEAIEVFKHLIFPEEPTQPDFEIGVTYVASNNKTAALEQYQQLVRLNSPLAEELLRKINEMK